MRRFRNMRSQMHVFLSNNSCWNYSSPKMFTGGFNRNKEQHDPFHHTSREAFQTVVFTSFSENPMWWAYVLLALLLSVQWYMFGFSGCKFARPLVYPTNSITGLHLTNYLLFLPVLIFKTTKTEGLVWIYTLRNYWLSLAKNWTLVTTRTEL